MMSATADPCAFNDYASLPARMDWPGRVNWIGRRRGRLSTSDRLDPGPLYHVRNARRVVYDFRCWLKPFRGVATKHLLRYFSWYVRIAAMAPARPCRGQTTLLRGPRGLLPAQAWVAPAKAG